MKFHFCQICGKRVSDDDIREGEAFDKKEKGVFCRECVSGLTTWDTAPLGDAEAKRIVAAEGKHAPKRTTGGARTRPRRTTDNVRLKRRTDAQGNRLQPHAPAGLGAESDEDGKIQLPSVPESNLYLTVLVWLSLAAITGGAFGLWVNGDIKSWLTLGGQDLIPEERIAAAPTLDPSVPRVSQISAPKTEDADPKDTEKGDTPDEPETTDPATTPKAIGPDAATKKNDDAESKRVAKPITPIPDGCVYLSTLEARHVSVGWSDIRNLGKPLRINGKVEPFALLMHPPEKGVARALFRLPEDHRIFRSTVSLSDEVDRADSPMVFEVHGDGGVLWSSGLVQTRADAKECRVEIKGVQRITLVVRCQASNRNAHAVWVNPRVLLKDEGHAKEPVPLVASKRNAEDRAEEALQRHWRAVVKALQSNDAGAATKAAKSIVNDGTLGERQALGKAVLGALAALEHRQKERIRALEKRKGQLVHVALSRASRPQDVEIVGVEDGILVVRTTYRINREKRFRTQRYKLDALPERAWAELAPPPARPSEDAWNARALSRLAVRDDEGFAKALSEAPEGALTRLFKQELERMEVGAETFDAGVHWERAARAYKEERWDFTAETLLAFKDRYGTGALSKARREQLNARFAELEERFTSHLCRTGYKAPSLPPHSFSMEHRLSDHARKAAREQQGRDPTGVIRMGTKTEPGAGIIFALDGAYRVFKARVGREDRHGKELTASVWGDDKLLWTSEPISKAHVFPPCVVNVTGVKRLKLTVNVGEEKGRARRAVLWVDPRVVKYAFPVEWGHRKAGPTASKGTSRPPDLPKSAVPGVMATYFQGPNFKKTLKKQIDRQPLLDRGAKDIPRGVSDYMFSVRWEGLLHIPKGGSQRIVWELSEQSGLRMRLGGQWLLGNQSLFVTDDQQPRTLALNLKEGLYSFSLDYYHKGGSRVRYRCKLQWKLGDKEAETLPLDKAFFYDPKARGHQAPRRR